MFSVKKYLGKITLIKMYRNKWLLAAMLVGMAADYYIKNRWFIYSLPLKNNPASGLVAEGLFSIITVVLNALLIFFIFYLVPKLREFKWPVTAKIAKGFFCLLIISILQVLSYLLLLAITSAIPTAEIFSNAWYYMRTAWLQDAIMLKTLTIICIQLSYQIGKKYTPGFFLDMTLGKYSIPRTEKRIIMFIDLKDSTPISEKLGHHKYFLFIRDFVYQVSSAALVNGGDIYQYVGDEVIVTWPQRKENNNKCIQTLIVCRKNLQAQSNHFRNEYGVIPEFRVGIHAGEVTVGEIGLVKKDIAMSGEAMNLTARIRSACSELNQKYIISQDYFDYTHLKEWQGEDLGIIPLKGIEKRQVNLYTLKI